MIFCLFHKVWCTGGQPLGFGHGPPPPPPAGAPGQQLVGGGEGGGGSFGGGDPRGAIRKLGTGGWGWHKALVGLGGGGWHASKAMHWLIKGSPNLPLPSLI